MWCFVCFGFMFCIPFENHSNFFSWGSEVSGLHGRVKSPTVMMAFILDFQWWKKLQIVSVIVQKSSKAVFWSIFVFEKTNFDFFSHSVSFDLFLSVGSFVSLESMFFSIWSDLCFQGKFLHFGGSWKIENPRYVVLRWQHCINHWNRKSITVVL